MDNIKMIVKKALNNKLTIEEFWDNWPFDIIPESHDIFKDIEGLVEHFPNNLFSNKASDSWYKSDIYLTAYLDYLILENFQGLKEIDEKRHELLSINFKSIESINKYFKSM